MDMFYRLNPKKLQRYQPYLSEMYEHGIENAHMNGWVYGQYFASSISANFSKSHKYPEKPYFIAHQHDDEEAYVMTDADRFAAWAEAFNAGHNEYDVIDAEMVNVGEAAKAIDISEEM